MCHAFFFYLSSNLLLIELYRDDATFKCEYDVLVAFLQNKEAEYKWKILENNLDELKYEFSRSLTHLLNYSP